MVKNIKTWISWERNGTYLRNEKVLNLCLIWHILRSYRFLAEVTIKQFSRCSNLKNCWTYLENFLNTNREGESMYIFTWLYYTIKQKISNSQIVKKILYTEKLFNLIGQIAFWSLTQQIHLFPDTTFDRMMTRTILKKFIFRKL